MFVTGLFFSKIEVVHGRIISSLLCLIKFRIVVLEIVDCVVSCESVLII